MIRVNPEKKKKSVRREKAERGFSFSNGYYINLAISQKIYQDPEFSFRDLGVRFIRGVR